MPRRNEVKAGSMKYVYMPQSAIVPNRYYVGSTQDLKRRFAEHNAGKSIHTNKFKPWRLITYVAFSDHTKADKFESYLKTSSGRTFAKRHF
jgi:predicted GIY-YIG superfamily endonuclease